MLAAWVRTVNLAGTQRDHHEQRLGPVPLHGFLTLPWLGMWNGSTFGVFVVPLPFMFGGGVYPCFLLMFPFLSLV